jgi:cell division protein FtsW
MGGSSFLFTCSALGIILSVAKNVESLEGAKAVEIVKTAENKNENGEEVNEHE